MVIIKRFFGLKSEIFCDRCHKAIQYDPHILCEECFTLSPKEIRRHQVNLSYPLVKEGLTCYLCKRKSEKVEFNHVCIRCICKHEDDSHSGWYINSDFPDDTLLYRHCICGCIVKITIGNPPTFEYYKVGNKKSSSKPFLCEATLEVEGRKFVFMIG
ncbi:hypothetical protein OB236_10780 [Paenibacillus sp. WQ 127069]|uniref:RNHCP domain-containing protein n=1 Tax=Paenibacillus baimaensis TaxID=2982185 RepID=A0ABT2UD94_9BACL|nr:hypothetical protein [Paenibacillus sp. WQ 127069]MCU6792604.1 hypothetical protein [Paenibacillus sp. WQ 127069]